jgi:hypothetical protein
VVFARLALIVAATTIARAEEELSTAPADRFLPARWTEARKRIL